MVSSIGIKIANGEFYPVLEEGSTVKKRLVLTTVHDGQRSVQIDLYRSESRSMADASYIGSLVVENIVEKPKGEPSIELVIGSDGSDELSAEAVDLDANGEGERQRLNVSLQALGGAETYDIPDFELESEAPSAPPAGLYEEGEPHEEPLVRRPFPLLAVLLILLALLAAALVAWFFFFRAPAADSLSRKTPAPAEASVPAPEPPAPAPAAEPAPAEAAPAIVEAPKPIESPAAAEPVRRTRPAAPVATYKVPQRIPKEGFRYRIRWGDTLWDISEAFYRNPWLYPRIARFNKIRNPDLIISGTYLRVPPKK